MNIDLAGSKHSVQVEAMNVKMYAGELKIDDIRRRLAGKEIGILGKFGNLSFIICNRPTLWETLIVFCIASNVPIYMISVIL